jgi:GT2 family glycosyltransferase
MALLFPAVTSLSQQQESIEAGIRQLRTTVLRRLEDVEALLLDMQSALPAPPQTPGAPPSAVEGGGHAGQKSEEYLRVVKAVRDAVRAATPSDAIVSVISKGDGRLLSLFGRSAWHFPRGRNGQYAGYHPANSSGAIIHLEVQRAQGAEYLVIPKPSFWWFESYADFKRYLDQHYRAIVTDPASCVVYALHGRAGVAIRDGWRDLEDVIAEYQNRFGGPPAVLDCGCGFDDSIRVPGLSVFSPPAEASPLPYLPATVDIVAMPSQTVVVPEHLADARRVARAAVLTVRPAGGPGGRRPEALTEWIGEEQRRSSPTVSVIIPSYNGMDDTEVCLSALQKTLPPEFRGEIIVVDDASTDDTHRRLGLWLKKEKRLKVIRNSQNVGFVDTCNTGAAAAAHDILVFLNMDTIPMPGWLPPLLRVFEDDAHTGAVGGKLVYPDGRLQEAGGVVYADGSGANFGKWDYNVDDPLYNFLREVDYCSGALLATPRAVFLQLGGFDVRYRPGYCEDSDYCFTLRENGYRVYYQPESVVVHIEGAAHGTDITAGTKRYQILNRERFVAKWGAVLATHPMPPDNYEYQTLVRLSVCGHG